MRCAASASGHPSPTPTFIRHRSVVGPDRNFGSDPAGHPGRRLVIPSLLAGVMPRVAREADSPESRRLLLLGHGQDTLKRATVPTQANAKQQPWRRDSSRRSPAPCARAPVWLVFGWYRSSNRTIASAMARASGLQRFGDFRCSGSGSCTPIRVPACDKDRNSGRNSSVRSN
jgi:hypothetical protein